MLLLDSRVTRISSSLVFSSTALAEQPGEDRPLLEVALNGRGGARTVNRLALQALGRLEMDYSILRTIDERSKREQKLLADAKEKEEPASFPREHPAAGLARPAEELLLPHRHRPWHAPPEAPAPALHHGLRRPGGAPGDARGGHEPAAPPHRPGEHLQAGDAQKAETTRKAERKQNPELEPGPIRPRGSAFPAPESIVASVEAAGFKKLRIACLWYRDETRLRMLDTFCKTFGLARRGTRPARRRGTQPARRADHRGVPLRCRLPQARALRQPEGGTGGERCLRSVPRTACSSAPGARPRSPRHPMPGTTARRTSTISTPNPRQRASSPDLDVPSQYLRGRDDKGVIKPKAKDHPAEMALLDLYRSLGIIDDRIANALQPEKAGYPVDRIAHVGIHVRQQNRRKGESGQPKVVITASALVPPEAAGGTWTMLGWSSTRP